MKNGHISIEERNEAKELFDILVNLYKEKANLEVLNREREEKLKDEVAQACNVKNKSREYLSKTVKMPLVKAILDQLEGKVNKKDIEADTMDTYRQAIKNNEINKESINAYLASQNLLRENQLAIKEKFKESTFLSKEMLMAIDILAKEKYKELKEDALNLAGFISKPKKDNNEILELVNQFKEVFKQ
ncbi:hypothetical protein [Campylobacter sp. US33a]|uniref:hypothetical protein n=1 Tax=Campylobacter sp. US33a TaxID=2498120 RepID=UPI001068A56C|nr:hypothetical protein [Campylobacter sp. US33a]TEX99568.1 hypothetical protein ELQ16_09705 [Campylobacter sp. US33a]